MNTFNSHIFGVFDFVSVSYSMHGRFRRHGHGDGRRFHHHHRRFHPRFYPGFYPAYTPYVAPYFYGRAPYWPWFT